MPRRRWLPKVPPGIVFDDSVLLKNIDLAIVLLSMFDWNCEQFFFVPVSVKKGTIRKTDFVTARTLSPLSQSWLAELAHPVLQRWYLFSLSLRLSKILASTLTEWGKGWRSYEICFADGTFFHRYRTPKNTKKRLDHLDSLGPTWTHLDSELN